MKMITTTKVEFAESMAAALTEKFSGEGQFASKFFTVRKGQKFDKIFQGQTPEQMGSVHCFVDNATGEVYKAAGLKAPAKGVRYSSVEGAVEAADLYGGYLYVR